MQGCVDLSKTNKNIYCTHIKMGRRHTYQQLPHHNDLIMKVDVYGVQIRPSEPDNKYMLGRFTWEGENYQCVGMPFGLALALRLATKMMVLVI